MRDQMLVFEGTGNSGAMARADHWHTGSGLRPATVVVAPANSHDTTAADVVLTGTADETLLNTALATATAYGAGVLVLDGDVYITDTVTIPSGGRLFGLGLGPVAVHASGGAFAGVAIDVGSGGEVSDLALYGIDDTQGTAIQLGYGGCGRRCYVQDWLVGVTLDADCFVTDSQLWTCGTAAHFVTGSGGRSQIIGNKIIGGGDGVVVDSDRAQIIGNWIGGNASEQDGIVVNVDGILSQIVANIVYVRRVGVSLGAYGCQASDNQIVSSNRHGIVVAHDDIVVMGNRIDSASQAAANTYDAIQIASGNRATIQANQCRVGGLSARYGLNVTAGATDALAINNDLKAGSGGAWGTAAFVDAGTGTVKNLDGSANNWNRT